MAIGVNRTLTVSAGLIKENNDNMFAVFGFIESGFVYSYSSLDYIEVWESSIDYKPDSNFTSIVCIGLGLKYIFDDHWILVGELGYRIDIF